METRATAAPKANRDRKVQRVTRARKVRGEIRATAAPKANRDRKVQRVTKGRRVTKVNPARRTCA